MKSKIIIFSLAFFLVACSTPEPTELKIQENDECMLNNPSQIASANDSAICIIDRTRAYQIDTRSGMINSIGFDEVSHDFAEFLSKISGQPLTDSTPIQPLAFSSWSALASGNRWDSGISPKTPLRGATQPPRPTPVQRQK